MVGLFDIAPPSVAVTINGIEQRVIGVPFRILVQTPELLGFLSGGGIDPVALTQKGPETVSAIIAAGFGMAEDEKAKKKAADLPFDVQLDLLTAILKATIGGGVGPFVEKLTGIRKLFEVEEEKVTMDTVEKIRLKGALRTMPKPSDLSAAGSDFQQSKFGT